MLNESREIVAFVQDKINGLYEEYKGAAPGEYDEQITGGMIAIMKHLLDTTIKIEALDKLVHLNFSDRHGDTDTEAIRRIFETILNH
jgi:hypothetical protein